MIRMAEQYSKTRGCKPRASGDDPLELTIDGQTTL